MTIIHAVSLSDIQSNDPLESNCVDCVNAPNDCVCNGRQCTSTTISLQSSTVTSTTGVSSSASRTSIVDATSSNNNTNNSTDTKSSSIATTVEELDTRGGSLTTTITVGVVGSAAGFLLGALMVFCVTRLQRCNRDSPRHDRVPDVGRSAADDSESVGAFQLHPVPGESQQQYQSVGSINRGLTYDLGNINVATMPITSWNTAETGPTTSSIFSSALE
jgi:hypothetical protein